MSRGDRERTAARRPPPRCAGSSTAAQAGDRDALEELYLIHFDRIYSYLHMTVGNRHDAEDLTTQTFLRMLESIGRFRWQSAPFSAWLFRIAHNLSMDHFRARAAGSRRRRCRSAGAEERSAEDEAFQSIGRKSMLKLIEGLSDEQRQVLTLKFVFNFTNGDVATILDKTEGAVKSLQHRALVSLQKQLRPPRRHRRRRGARGRHRRPARRGQDHAVQRADAGAQRGRVRQGARRHGADPRRAPAGWRRSSAHGR